MITESFVADGFFKQKIEYRRSLGAYMGLKEGLLEKFKGTEEERFVKGFTEIAEELLQLTEDESYKEGVKRGIRIMQELE